ncbi:MAG TPA: Crp/Fnr family transcriptional regulator [Beijerinckiaceae bacterium]|nr:Crp/Fnr family transcriptional regulator [Beijerinckiaceae bacterium]
MTHPLVRKLELFAPLSDEEKRVLEKAPWRIREYGADEDVLSEGDRASESTLVLDGFSCRYKLLPDGRRQITSFNIAGDFVDLHSFLLKQMDHGVATLTPCRMGALSHEVIRDISERYPRLARALWWDTVVDGSIFRQWMIGIGRRTALGRIAHLLCELHARLHAMGLATNGSYAFPVTQTELGDALGLSTVHVNRVLQELRGKGLISLRGGTLAIHDAPALQEVASFDAAYLYLHGESRDEHTR